MAGQLNTKEQAKFVAKHLKRLGLNVDVEKSDTDSHYIRVDDGGKDKIKIRISNHRLPAYYANSVAHRPDFDAGTYKGGDDHIDAVIYAAHKFNKELTGDFKREIGSEKKVNERLAKRDAVEALKSAMKNI